MRRDPGRNIGDYVVSVLNGMAQGLFSSMIIGLIIKQIGTYAGLDWLASFGQAAQCLTCPAIGIGVGYSIGAKGLSLLSAATAGRSRKKCRDKIEASVGFVSHLSRLYLGFISALRAKHATNTRRAHAVQQKQILMDNSPKSVFYSSVRFAAK